MAPIQGMREGEEQDSGGEQRELLFYLEYFASFIQIHKDPKEVESNIDICSSRDRAC